MGILPSSLPIFQISTVHPAIENRILNKCKWTSKHEGSFDELCIDIKKCILTFIFTSPRCTIFMDNFGLRYLIILWLIWKVEFIYPQDDSMKACSKCTSVIWSQVSPKGKVRFSISNSPEILV